GDDREAADEQEQGAEAVAGLFGGLQHALLGLLDRGSLAGQWAQGGVQLGGDRVAARLAGLDPAGVGDEGEGARVGGRGRSAGGGGVISPVRWSGAAPGWGGPPGFGVRPGPRAGGR